MRIPLGLRAAAGATGGAPPTGGWDITNASYSGNSFSVNSQEAAPRSVFFKDDGTKMYIYGSSGNDVNEYSLSTAWSVTTASYTTVSPALPLSAVRGMFIGDSGTKLYIIDNVGNVRQHNMTTAWDASTAPATSTNSLLLSGISSESIWFDSSGTRFYVGASTSVYQYSLSTAWDISSTLTAVQNVSFSAQISTAGDVVFKPDGTKMFILDDASPKEVVQYSLSTAWDISTATHDASFTFSQEGTPEGLYFRPDTGTQFFIVGVSNDTVYAYDT